MLPVSWSFLKWRQEWISIKLGKPSCTEYRVIYRITHLSFNNDRFVALSGFRFNRDCHVEISLQLLNKFFGQMRSIINVEHNHQWERPLNLRYIISNMFFLNMIFTYNELLPCQIDVVNRSSDSNGSFPNGWNVWIWSIGKQNSRVGFLHDPFQSNVSLDINGN